MACPDSAASGIKSKNTAPINDPEAKPTRAIKMRPIIASFKPTKSIPMKDTRLTIVTEARIMIRSIKGFHLSLTKSFSLLLWLTVTMGIRLLWAVAIDLSF